MWDAIDRINDNIATWVAIFRNQTPPVTSQQTSAAVYLASQQQQQRTIMILGLGALAVYAMTRKG